AVARDHLEQTGWYGPEQRRPREFRVPRLRGETLRELLARAARVGGLRSDVLCCVDERDVDLVAQLRADAEVDNERGREQRDEDGAACCEGHARAQAHGSRNA